MGLDDEITFGRVIVVVCVGALAVSVFGRTSVGGAGSGRAVERAFLSVDIGGITRLTGLLRVFTVGKADTVC